MTAVKLDIISDPICPWCYIGKTNLDRALSANPDHPFVIEWHPFQLNPDMPETGMDRQTYVDTKFGGRENGRAVYDRIDAAAREAGLAINWQGIATTPNTLNAHRLIHWAGIEGRQTPAVAALFRAYFQDGRDIGDRTVLADIADSVGLDRAMIAQLLDGPADLDDIRARDAHSRQAGVSGVPTFVVGNRHVVPGAQPAELWSRVIAELRDAAGDDDDD